MKNNKIKNLDKLIQPMLLIIFIITTSIAVFSQDISYRNGKYIPIAQQPANPNDPSIPKGTYDAVAKKFAPLVYLADAKYRPGSAATYFEKSVVTCCDRSADHHFGSYESSFLEKVNFVWEKWNVGSGSKNGARMGSKQDSFWLYIGKDNDTQHSRGYLGGDPFKKDSEGLYTDTPVNYHVLKSKTENAINIQYWLFYPNNGNSSFVGGKALGQHGAHEGDWELVVLNISDPLNSPKIAGMWLFAHGKPNPVSLDAINYYDGSHPIVYSAENSHATYNSIGKHKTSKTMSANDFTAKNARWTTWTNLTDMGSLSLPYNGSEWIWFNGRWGKTKALGADSPSGPAFQSDWFKILPE